MRCPYFIAVSLNFCNVSSFNKHFLSPGAFSIISFPQNVTINETGTASFFCNATSFFPHEALATKITWSKQEDSSLVFPHGEQLVLQNVTHSDEGTYICTANNGLGLPDTASALLAILREYPTNPDTIQGCGNDG